MTVDADNNIIESNSKNNPATYLANPIRIESLQVADESKPPQIHENHEAETDPRTVELSRKSPMVWSVQKTALLQNYPNPFNPETWIPFQLHQSASVVIRIYDARGILVRDLELGHRVAGTYHSRAHAAYWDGRNETGEPVASGVYFYRFVAGDFSQTRRMLIVK